MTQLAKKMSCESWGYITSYLVSQYCLDHNYSVFLILIIKRHRCGTVTLTDTWYTCSRHLHICQVLTL